MIFLKQLSILYATLLTLGWVFDFYEEKMKAAKFILKKIYNTFDVYKKGLVFNTKIEIPLFIAVISISPTYVKLI